MTGARDAAAVEPAAMSRHAMTDAARTSPARGSRMLCRKRRGPLFGDGVSDRGSDIGRDPRCRTMGPAARDVADRGTRACENPNVGRDLTVPTLWRASDPAYDTFVRPLSGTNVSPATAGDLGRSGERAGRDPAGIASMTIRGWP